MTISRLMVTGTSGQKESTIMEFLVRIGCRHFVLSSKLVVIVVV